MHLENPYTNEAIKTIETDNECVYNTELAILKCKHTIPPSQFLSIFRYVLIFIALIFVFSVQINFIFDTNIVINGLFMEFGRLPFIIIGMSMCVGFVTAKSRLRKQ